MSQQTFNLDIPDDLYHELKKRAEAARLPVEVELLNLTAAMLALSQTNTLANELIRHFEEVSRAARAELLDALLTSRRSSGEKRHALDILAELPGHQAFQTAEEVDRYVREERESWES